MINESRFDNFRVGLDRVLDYVPVVSTAINAIDLIQKEVFKNKKNNDNSVNNDHYYTYLSNKDSLRCFILLIPFVGNFIIAIHDLVKEYKKPSLGKDENNKSMPNSGSDVEIGKSENWSQIWDQAEGGDLNAMILVANLYQEQYQEQSKYMNEAIEWYEKVAEAAFNEAEKEQDPSLRDQKYVIMATASFELGNLYKENGNVENSIQKYLITYNALLGVFQNNVVEQDSKHFDMLIISALKIAESYKETDIDEAIEWYKKAVDLGAVEAYIELASLYKNKTDLSKEEKLSSLNFYILAAAVAQNEEAIEFVNKFAKDNNDVFLPYIRDIVPENINKEENPSQEKIEIRKFLQKFL